MVSRLGTWLSKKLTNARGESAAREEVLQEEFVGHQASGAAGGGRASREARFSGR